MDLLHDSLRSRYIMSALQKNQKQCVLIGRQSYPQVQL